MGPEPTPPVPPPAPSPLVADLKAIETTVERHRGDDITNLAKDEVVNILEDDEIAVVDKGWGELRYADRLIIELHQDTELGIDDVGLDRVDGSIFLRLKQTIGSSRVELSEIANDRVELVTDHATLTSGGSPTIFVVCHAEPVTCMFVEAGDVTVKAQDVEVIVTGGSGTYILKGEPPQPPICGDMAEFRSWLEEQRRAQTDVPLVALVQEWDENDPCQPVKLEPTEPTPTGLPPGDGMVQIPAGQYEIGRQQADDYHLPSTQVELDVFWLDVFEVTNAQYEIFVSNTGHPAPADWPGGTYQAGREEHPVKGVTWDDAQAYCAWVHKRLPTEAEWEVAARGPEIPSPLFPWGNDDSFAGGEMDNLPREDTYQVGTATFNRSHFGVYDLAANVWEWVGEPYGPVADGSKLLRGGRHGFLRDMAYRQQAAPDDPSFVPFAGFRCAADQVEGE